MATSIRDASCRQLEPGKYMMSRPGEKHRLVEVEEDQHCDYWIVVKTPDRKQPVRQRVDELALDVTFHRVGETADILDQLPDAIAGPSLEELDALLREANELRGGLLRVERTLCDLLGCGIGDGSHESDTVMAAVRDGVGSSVELLALNITP